jgi:NADH:ubiquinone oxidoreductase subunit E
MNEAGPDGARMAPPRTGAPAVEGACDGKRPFRAMSSLDGEPARGPAGARPPAEAVRRGRGDAMLVTDRQRLRDDIAAWVERFGARRSSLIPVLQEIQAKYHQISDHAMQVVADHLDIHPVEVYSVVTFYAFFNEGYHGKFVIRLCRTISCDMAGHDRIARQLENDLGITFGQTTRDGKFSLEWASCLGMCDQGPALLVNDQVFARMTPEKVHDVLQLCRKSFGPVAVHGFRPEEARP